MGMHVRIKDFKIKKKKIYVQKGSMGVVICTWNERKRNMLETYSFTEEII